MGELLMRRREMLHSGEPQSDLVYELETPMSFDGTNGVDTGIALVGNYSDGTASPFTILFDGTPSNVSGDKYLFAGRSASLGKVMVNASLYNSGNLYTAWFANSNGNTGNSFGAGKIVRVSVTFSPETGAVYKWSVNGSSVKTKTYSTTPSGAIIAETDTIKVGMSAASSTSGRFKGVINAFKIYRRKFTNDEISGFLANGIS